ncbi:MAG: hypothetical protein DMD74_12830 [Gemmatimonadetes bacterium]|nr:MAG: hypothetical protein DMD74_12830 [Gemmatimonadota bacterium]
MSDSRVFFAANQHINPTNVCVLRNTCVFCSFARMPKEDGAYTRSLDEVFAEADAARDNPTREFHIVGGLHPKLRLEYYVDMFRGLKERHPQVMIKALTAVEVAHLARIEGMSTRDVLLAMKEAGVSTLPGGGAEVFSPAARATIADRKLTGDEWLAVHREAHALGIPSNCTMLYGHVETLEDRVDHLLALRALQDETHGFLCYIPLAYHPDHNELGEAGAGTPMWLSYDQIVSLIRGAGKEPVERDSLYQPVRTFEDWVPGQASARPQGPAGPTFHLEPRRAAAARRRALPVLSSAVDGAE